MSQRKDDITIRLGETAQRSRSQQEAYIAEKKYHLSVLYDVADCINSSTSLDDLLYRFLLTMQGLVSAKAAAIRLLVDGSLKLVSSIGLPIDASDRLWQLSESDCLCVRSFHDNCVTRESVMSQCRLSAGTSCEQLADCEMLAIPLRYQGKSIGIYNLFISRNEARESTITDEDAVLHSIGKHLGMAIEQASVEDNARKLSIIQERTRMAHELHDSLAQTLASLRYKIRLLDDSLRAQEADDLREELKGLENGVETANAELRSLITQFRAPIDGKGVVRTIESIVERFRRETGFDVFFYHNWDFKDLARDAEIEVVRIVQEGLSNIRKHSGSETVRILLYSSVDGDCSVLIEDDGPGLSEDRPKPNKLTGEHIGLSVMQERAERLNGELQFESDGEGLLLQLNFKVAVPNSPNAPNK